ncbi:CRISPR-associated protein Cas4 [Candidatus Woesearchaeota archaeon]|nr:CRISPR-associated protein Cas4 [Candidatus Woesearchaeota archaeon]
MAALADAEGNGMAGVVEEAIADSEKPAPVVSVTDLSSFMYCPRALYRQKVLGYEEKPNERMILGAIRHNFYDMANKYEEAIVVHLPKETTHDETVSAYTKTYENLLKAAVMSHAKSLALFDIQPFQVLPQLQQIAAEEAHERAGNVHRFSAQQNVFGEELWEVLTPKIFTEVRVKSQPLRLKGVVDRVEVYENSVLPIELKTGKMAHDGVWPSHRVQVAAYMMLLKEKFRKPVSQAVVRYLDHNSSKTVVLNPYMELEVRELTEKVIRLLQSQTAPKPCGRESCSCTRGLPIIYHKPVTKNPS